MKFAQLKILLRVFYWVRDHKADDGASIFYIALPEGPTYG